MKTFIGITFIATFVFTIISKDTNAIFFHERLVTFSRIYMEACTSIHETFLQSITHINSISSERGELDDRLYYLEKDNRILQDEIHKLRTDSSIIKEQHYSKTSTFFNLQNITSVVNLCVSVYSLYNGVFPPTSVVIAELCSKDRETLDFLVKDVLAARSKNAPFTTEIMDIKKLDPVFLQTGRFSK